MRTCNKDDIQMKSVTVVMSTYNGSKYITQQLDSIFCQKEVEITCYVRDDGSSDDTVNILQSYVPSSGVLIADKGDNVGWERSFMLALKDAPQSEYYAFADQDDIWFEDKLIKGIQAIEMHGNHDQPVMYHCNKISVTEDLKPLPHQVRRTPRPLNRQNAMGQEYAQGCSIILNEEARQLVVGHIPTKKIAHDFWCGLLCYLFGEVVYDDEPSFFHISHGNNASGEGHILGSWMGRFAAFFKSGEVYYAPYEDLLQGFESQLTLQDKNFIRQVLNYRQHLSCKLKLLFSLRFVRDSILGTLSLKMAILLNRL